MSKAKKSKQRRSFKFIFKIFKLLIALAFTFVISFTVTLALKIDNPADYLASLGNELFPPEDSIKSTGASEICNAF